MVSVYMNRLWYSSTLGYQLTNLGSSFKNTRLYERRNFFMCGKVGVPQLRESECPLPMFSKASYEHLRVPETPWSSLVVLTYYIDSDRPF